MSTVLWTGQDFTAALGGKVIGNLPATIDGIAIDSRTLNKGDAFFAICGERFDGHDFVSAAVQKGASILVIAASHANRFSSLACPLVIVPDVLAALEDLGRSARARSRAKIIAVTGSVGKTTTKEALRHLLRQIGSVHASPASFNNHWGVPLTLARMPQNSDFAVFEIGMNHAGEILPLVTMVRPHIALITRIASVHRAYFTSLEEIARAKAEIFDGLEKNGTALIPRDDEQFAFLAACADAAGVTQIASFGEDANADYWLIKWQECETGSHCCFSLRGHACQADLGARGEHMAINMLGCLGVMDLLQLDMSRILPAVADFTAPGGRGARHILQLEDGATCLLLDESYNANPTSMHAALKVLAATKPHHQGRRIAVLGDMLELGEESQHAHAGLVAPILASAVDSVFLLGGEMRSLAALLQQAGMEVVWRENWQELTALIAESLKAGDVISVKSSKATGACHIVTALLESVKN